MVKTNLLKFSEPQSIGERRLRYDRQPETVTAGVAQGHMNLPGYSSLIFILILLNGLAQTHAQEPVNVNCNADLLCVKVYKGEVVRLVLENKTDKPLSFNLFFTTANLRHLNPAKRLLSQPLTSELVSFTQPDGKWGYEYRIHYGHESHTHDDDYLYTLPYRPGSAYRISQSHTNITTHRYGNLYAIDWDMPVGDPVHAARGGVVVSTYDQSDATSASGSATANHIWVQHSDATIGKYLHLDHEGIFVTEGQTVAAGQRIGTSGNTGFSSGPHLHFSVSSIGGDILYQTFNIRFATRAGPQYLVGDRSYQHPQI